MIDERKDPIPIERQLASPGETRAPSTTRRRLVALLALAAPVAACFPRREPRAALADVLGLEGHEVAWLEGLKPRQVDIILAAFEGDPAAVEPAVDHLLRLLDQSPRLLAYVGVPRAGTRLPVCDGMVRE